MSYITGIVLGFLIGLFGRLAGFDRDRAFYPTVVIVTASYYVLFAVMGGSTRTLVLESGPMVLFASMAVVGFRWSLWWIVAAFAAHGVFDLVHDQFVSNPGVPTFWPSFCLAIDVILAAFLAWLLQRGMVRLRRPDRRGSPPHRANEDGGRLAASRASNRGSFLSGDQVGSTPK